MRETEALKRVNKAYIASQIWSTADVETISSYESNIDHYKENSYSFIPLPDSYKYYDVEESELKKMSGDQWITVDFSILKVIELLTKEDFLIVDGAVARVHEKDDGEKIDLNEYRKNKQEWESYVSENEVPESRHEERYHIITWTDLKKKVAKEAIYPLVSEVSTQLADKIEDHLPESEEIPFDQIKDETLGRWFYDRRQGKELHIAEYLDLTEMKQVIKSDEELREKCGFPSNTKLKDQLYHVEELRNKIMHANRTLVNSQDEVEELHERLGMIQSILDNLS